MQYSVLCLVLATNVLPFVHVYADETVTSPPSEGHTYS